MTDKFTEIKRGKIIINRTNSSNSYKLILPKRWAETLGLSTENKDIKITYENEERIVIEKF